MMATRSEIGTHCCTVNLQTRLSRTICASLTHFCFRRLYAIVPTFFSAMPPHFPLPQPLEEIACQATQCMERGISQLTDGHPDALLNALTCFDQALQLRLKLPWQDHSWYRWLLTACWMNRGDVLTRESAAQNLAEAVRSFDEAIKLLEHLPLDEHPTFRRRLALAWMNRALALRAQGNAKSLNEALQSLTRSLEVLLSSSEEPDSALHDSILLNRATLLLQLSRPQEALLEACQLIEKCRPAEHSNQIVAEIGLKARHAYCLAVATLLETPPVEAKQADEWILRATDEVEEAIDLAVHWEKVGASAHFAELRHELFRFGCRMYLAWQPHFLAEFLLDVLEPERDCTLNSATADLRVPALEALALAAQELRRRGPLDLGLKGMDRLLEVLESLNLAAEKIKKLPIHSNEG